MPRWLTTPLAASAASFHPSNAAIATGLTSGPSTSLNLMTSPPLEPRAGAYDYSLRLHVAWACDLWQAQFHVKSFVLSPLSPTLSKPMSGLAIQEATERATALRGALAERVVIADGAMGTMLQASDATLEDFGGHEGCNEVLNVTRPDIVRDIRRAYLAVGADCVTPNTFGANLGNLSEYGIPQRIGD